MSALARALELIRPDQAAAIQAVVAAAEGHDRIDDLAFVIVLLEALERFHGDSSTGWAIVSAYKSLLSAARSEGFDVEGQPPLRPMRRKTIEVPMDTWRKVGELNAERDERLKMQRRHVAEVAGLRSEIQGLREALVERDRQDAEREKIRKETQDHIDYLATIVGNGAG